MELVNKYSYIWLCQNLINKKVNFISDCEFFPNFNVIGYITDIKLSKTSNEILFTINTTNNKKLIIGSNMKNLQFKIIN